MTRVALSLLLGGLALCTAVSGCGGDDSAAAGATPLAGTQWALDVEDVHSWIEFDPGSRVNGNDGCNSFSGSYQTNGSRLKFGPLAGTRMACAGAADAVSRKVTAALPRVRAYEVAGDTLHLQDGGGTTLLSYKAGKPGVEGAWTVLSVLYDDAIRSVVVGTDLTADFGADGKISGDTGCNTFQGEYALDGKRLHIGPLAATEKACASAEATKQEAGYLAALESAVRIEQSGPQLTLLNDKGQMAVTLTRK